VSVKVWSIFSERAQCRLLLGGGWPRETKAAPLRRRFEARAGAEAAPSAAGAVKRRRCPHRLNRRRSCCFRLDAETDRGDICLSPSLSQTLGRLPHLRAHTLDAAATLQRSIRATAGYGQALADLRAMVSRLAHRQQPQAVVHGQQPQVESLRLAPAASLAALFSIKAESVQMESG
jgi:hypothetical protein